jgi:hypothetical protein
MVDYISTPIPTQALFEMRANTAAPAGKMRCLELTVELRWAQCLYAAKAKEDRDGPERSNGLFSRTSCTASEATAR